MIVVAKELRNRRIVQNPYKRQLAEPIFSNSFLSFNKLSLMRSDASDAVDYNWRQNRTTVRNFGQSRMVEVSCTDLRCQFSGFGAAIAVMPCKLSTVRAEHYLQLAITSASCAD